MRSAVPASAAEKTTVMEQYRKRTRESVETDHKGEGKRTRAETDSECLRRTQAEKDSECRKRTRAETDSECRKRTQAETDSECRKRTRVEIDSECRKRTRVEIDSECRKRTRVERTRVERTARTSTDNSPRSAAVYSITHMPEDGSCLFHSVGHGSRLRLGLDPPVGDVAQRQLAAELRSKVVDELIKQRDFVAPFVEGDFDQYVKKMRKPTAWGGERELLMLSSVLQMPITVYKFEHPRTGKGPLIVAAEYGQQYMSETTESPIQVLHHTWGHYDVVHVDAVQTACRSRR